MGSAPDKAGVLAYQEVLAIQCATSPEPPDMPGWCSGFKQVCPRSLVKQRCQNKALNSRLQDCFVGAAQTLMLQDGHTRALPPTGNKFHDLS